MNSVNEFTIIFNGTDIIWILNQSAEKSIVHSHNLVLAKNDFNAKRFSAGQDHIFRLRENFIVNEKFSRSCFIRSIYIVK